MTHAQTRITLGSLLGAVTLGLVFGDLALNRATGQTIAPVFWTVLPAMLLVACWEFHRMLRVRGFPSRPVIAGVFIVLLMAAAWIEIRRPLSIPEWLNVRGLELYLLLVMALVFTTFVAYIITIERSGGDMAGAMAGVGWTVLMVLTLGVPAIFLAKVRFLSADPLEGSMYLLLALVTVKLSDIGAYAVGSTLGRHKLVPTLSPKKTWEGLAGALVGGTAAAVAIGCLWGRFTWHQMLVFGLAVSIASVLGDLGESLVKRACGVKDSGPIPGFGGILDILDSVLGAAPVAYLVLVLLTDALPIG
ncbi:MAG: phosphatidate cytidylyltransferase [Planctomycetota bacterium]|nr:phosphatidate cytidylyltransferase [Planctomycetota bacterium]